MTGARILVVDDNALNRKIISSIASNQGHQVEQAAGGEEALGRLRLGGIDVVLLDLIMPDMDGFAVLKAIKEDDALRNIPVIVISGLEGMDGVIRSLEMGAVDYLPKPVDAVLLRARLNAILADKRLRDSERRHIVELSDVQARLAAIIDGSPLGIVLFDLDGRAIEANPTFRQLARQSGADLSGMDIVDFFGNRSASAEGMRSHIREKREGSFCEEALMVRGDGTRFNARLTVSVVPGDSSGGFAVAMVEDVTDRAFALEALKQNEDNLRRVFESAPFPLIITEMSGMILEMNQKAADLVEQDRAQMRGEDIMGYYHDNESKKDIKRLIRAQGHIDSLEIPFVTISGRNRWLMISVQQTTLGGVACYLIAAYDITERREMEWAIQQANRKLGLLNSITRHDILNQTLVLTGYLELLGKTEKDTTQTKYLDRMSIATDNIRKQINFTKDYQDMGVKAPEWFNLSKVMTSAFKQLSPTGVELRLDTNGYCVQADPLVEKVFYNLIDNTMRHGKDVHNIGLSCAEEGDSLKVAYTDDGGGITPEDKERLFERGFGKNTGLGLFLTREILGITGISIAEAGQPGVGVRFEIVVPPGRFRTDLPRPGQ
jgi:PAS domain S-box-containing protein